MANSQEIWQSALNTLTDNRKKLKVYRGNQIDIERLTPEDGALYFAKDTKKIFLGAEVTTAIGTEVKLIQMSSSAGGSGNSGFEYAAADLNEGTLVKVNNDVDNIDNPGYYIYRQAFNFALQPFPDANNAELIVYKPVFLEGEANLPDVDTLIFNSNGWIFRVIEVQGQENRVLANLISSGTAGGGSGGGGSTAAEDLYLDWGNGWGSGLTYIAGQDYELTFTGTADRDNNVLFYIYIKDEANNIIISDGTEP